jgi:hypothetical protein
MPALAAVAAIAVVVGVVELRSDRDASASAGGGGGSKLRPLRIGDYGPAAPVGKGDGRYVLRGTLPTSPRSGTVWALARIDDAAQRTADLAAALGVHGKVVHDSQGWTVRDGQAQVRVYDADGSPWGFAANSDFRGCAPIPVDGYRSSTTAVSCAIDWTPDAGSVSDAAAAAAADPVLAAAGLGAAPADIAGDAPMRSVSAQPVVDGVTTDGLGTTVQVRPSGVAMAGGWLAPATGALKAVGTYPLRSAKDAFDGLNSLPVPEIACAPQPNSCPLDAQVVITGANPGLMSAWEDGSHPLLVPSWVFTVSGGGNGPVQNALDPAYVRIPANQDGGSATSPASSGGSVGTEPAPAPSGPYGIDPVAPIPMPSAPMEKQTD